MKKNHNIYGSEIFIHPSIKDYLCVDPRTIKHQHNDGIGIPIESSKASLHGSNIPLVDGPSSRLEHISNSKGGGHKGHGKIHGENGERVYKHGQKE